jgi:hypothetical protein
MNTDQMAKAGLSEAKELASWVLAQKPFAPPKSA